MNLSRSKSSPGRVLALAAGIPIALVAIAWIALTVLFPPAKVKALVEDQLHRSLARDVRFEGASLGLWPPVRLTVRKPQLAEPGGFDAGVAFGAQAVYLDLDVAALLSRKVRVRRFTIDQPAVHLLLRADGTSNFDSLGAAPAADQPAQQPMDLDVREFAIRGGQVLVDDMRANRRVGAVPRSAPSVVPRQGPAPASAMSAGNEAQEVDDAEPTAPPERDSRATLR